jgi:hypothetical protein
LTLSAAAVVPQLFLSAADRQFRRSTISSSYFASNLAGIKGFFPLVEGKYALLVRLLLSFIRMPDKYLPGEIFSSASRSLAAILALLLAIFSATTRSGSSVCLLFIRDRRLEPNRRD